MFEFLFNKIYKLINNKLSQNEKLAKLTKSKSTIKLLPLALSRID
jgi:hypothetical protein